MVVDSSALIAILLNEPEAESFKQAIASADRRLIASVTFVEAAIVAFDARMTKLAVDAFARYGKGRHPAALNFGDCCCYAFATAIEEPLLFKGADFARTDLASAL